MKVTNAVVSVLAERERQQAEEGWTPEHDDEHCNGELAMAAVCYINETGTVNRNGGKPWGWPWDASWWKPNARRRNLVKAGALILAEIERLDRSEGLPVPAPGETNYGFELYAIREFLGIPPGVNTLDYIKAVEECRDVPVQRNEVGMWTHPAYLKAFGGCDSVPAGMFNAWLQHLDLESKTVVFSPNDIGEISWEDVAEWEPEAPDGQGWFIGSIHESEDYGVVCVWLRKTK